MKLWSGRVGGELAPEVWDFLRADDAELLPYDLQATQLHAERLHAAGILDDSELAEATERLAAIDEIDESDEDVHSSIERQLGDVGRKIHAGRSRNDIMRTESVAIKTSVKSTQKARFAPDKEASLITCLCSTALATIATAQATRSSHIAAPPTLRPTARNTRNRTGRASKVTPGAASNRCSALNRLGSHTSSAPPGSTNSNTHTSAGSRPDVTVPTRSPSQSDGP